MVESECCAILWWVTVDDGPYKKDDGCGAVEMVFQEP